jgi:hypothetical protein
MVRRHRAKIIDGKTILLGACSGILKKFRDVWRVGIPCRQKPFRLPLRGRGLSERRMPRTTRRSSLLEGPAPSGPWIKPIPHDGPKHGVSLSLPPIPVRRSGAQGEHGHLDRAGLGNILFLIETTRCFV